MASQRTIKNMNQIIPTEFKVILDDPDFNQQDALNMIELPYETLNLIDKVVRMKAKQGPIGIIASEVMNIELEKEQQQKNKYIDNLINKQKQDAYGQLSSQSEQQDAEDEKNEKLLQRLH